MRYELKSIGVWAFIKIAFFINLVIGFISGLIMAIYIAFMVSAGIPLMQLSQEMESFQASMGVIMFLFPILGALFGAFFYTIFEVILVFIYNLFTRMLGGLEFELKEIKTEIVPPQPAQSPVYATTPPAPPPPAPVTPPPAPETSTPPPQSEPPAPETPYAADIFPHTPPSEPKPLDSEENDRQE